MSLVSVGFQESVGTIAMQHAERRNALSEALVGEIIAALEDFDRQKARAVILRAARGSKVWSAGHDVRELPLTRRDPLGWSDPLRMLVRALEELPAPVIALIEGGVWGGACEVALACDIVVAARSASFIQAFCKIGLIPDSGGTYFLPRLVGTARAMGLAMLGDKLTAEQAEEWGLIWKCVDDAELAPTVDALLAQLAQAPTRGLAAIKRAIYGSSTVALEDALTVERDLQRELGYSADYREGVDAFLNKRPPRFKGR